MKQIFLKYLFHWESEVSYEIQLTLMAPSF